MTRAVAGVLLIVVGMAGFTVGGDLVFVRAVGLGFAVVGVLMLIVSMIDKEG